jgi:hypothetical protein
MAENQLWNIPKYKTMIIDDKVINIYGNSYDKYISVSDLIYVFMNIEINVNKEETKIQIVNYKSNIKLIQNLINSLIKEEFNPR